MARSRVLAPCHFCERDLNPRAVGSFELVTGWGEYRADGGMNAVRLPELHRKFAHKHCIDLAKRGHRAGQSEMLDEAETEDLPPWDGTQDGFTPVGCPQCGAVVAAKHMTKHLLEVHDKATPNEVREARA